MSSTGSNRPRSALADAAEKLAGLARTALEQRSTDAPGSVRFPVTEVYSMSPDEVWSRKYMSQGIGPVPDCTAPGGYCALPFSQITPAPAAPQSITAGVVAEAAPQYKSSQIGQAIGKPPRKRFWLGRAFKGSP